MDITIVRNTKRIVEEISLPYSYKEVRKLSHAELLNYCRYFETQVEREVPEDVAIEFRKYSASLELFVAYLHNNFYPSDSLVITGTFGLATENINTVYDLVYAIENVDNFWEILYINITLNNHERDILETFPDYIHVIQNIRSKYGETGAYYFKKHKNMQDAYNTYIAENGQWPYNEGTIAEYIRSKYDTLWSNRSDIVYINWSN